jgi:serine/threonine protein kinase
MFILDVLHHKNIVQLYDSFESKSHFCFVMELCGGGDLHSYIRRRTRLTEDAACFVFRQVCDAVSYCHEKGIVHRDIKPDNLLLHEDGEVKLCDFGVSRQVDVDTLLKD